MARFVLRGLAHPDKVAKLDPEKSLSSQVTSELRKAFAHARWRTLQKVSDRLFGPDPADGTYGQLPKDITAEQFADAVMKDRSFHGAAVDTTLQEVVRQLGGGDAGEEPVNTAGDVVEFVRRRISDEICATAYRITRRSLGFMAGREVAAAGSDPEKCIAAAGEAVRAELATARDERVRVVRKVSIALFGALLPGQDADNEDALIERLRSAVRYSDEQRTTPANARYADLRCRYSAEHDAQHHTREEFIQGAVALLLGDNEAVQTENSTGDGRRLTMVSTPEQLWRFADTPVGWRYFAAARKRSVIWRTTEAAALLMCALEMPDDDDEA